MGDRVSVPYQPVPIRATAQAVAAAADAESGLQTLVEAFGRHLRASVALLAYTWYDPDQRIAIRTFWTRDRLIGHRALPGGIDNELLARALRSGDGVFTAELDGKASSRPGPRGAQYCVTAQIRADGLQGMILATLDEPPEPPEAATEASRDFAALATICLRNAVRQERLRDLATHDELTGCLNRAGILDALESEVARCERHGSPAALCFLDVEGFRAVNERSGHLAGDQVLSEVGRRLRHAIRPYDACGRYGGDEFLVVMPETDREAATAVTERLIAAIEEAEVDGVALSASYGLAEWGPGRDADELLRLSDSALFAAKRQARRRPDKPAGETPEDSR